MLCALFITGDIVGRNLLGVSSAATVEITGYMFAVGIAWSLAHALATRAHIRVDVLANRLPVRWRAPLHLVSLALLIGFAAFCAWAGWRLWEESALFGARDNSALQVRLVWPQGIWAAGLAAFVVMGAVLWIEALLNWLGGRPGALDRALGPRSIQDETAEALDAVRIAREPRSPSPFSSPCSVEIVTRRLSAIGRLPKPAVAEEAAPTGAARRGTRCVAREAWPVFERDMLRDAVGPAIVEEAFATHLLPTGWRAARGPEGALILTRGAT